MEYSEENFDADDDEKALMDQQAEQSGSVRWPRNDSQKL
uniref:Uncharacterized protein n=1 Tax=Arundo donax TaxID=35708 RepID=A0A0A9BHD3_ARUDO